MNHNVPIPTSIEAVTADWLTAALHQTGSIGTYQVRSIQIKQIKSQGILGYIYRLLPVYSKSEPGQAVSLILKFPLLDPEFRKGMAGANRNEVRFYEELAAQVGIRTPKMYFAGFDEPTCTSVLLLEDLSSIATPGCLACGCSLPEAEAVILNMAKLHARWWQVPDGQLPWIGSKKDGAYSVDQAYFHNLLTVLYEKVGAQLPGYAIPASFRSASQWFADHFLTVKERLYGSRQTLIHDDCHLANLFFQNAPSLPEPILLDWHFLSKANGVCDLGYFIGMCLAEDQRQEAEHRLTHLYYDTLIQNGVQEYSFEQFQTEYCLSCIEPLERLCQAIFALDGNEPRSRAFFLAVLDRLIPFVSNSQAQNLIS